MTAYEIYESLCDMDYRDYLETKKQDIEYIQQLIDKHGEAKAIELLKDMLYQ